MKKHLLLLLIYFFCNGIYAQIETFIDTKLFVRTNSQNPFWLYTNQQGRVDNKTDFYGLISSNYNLGLNEKSNLLFGTGIFYQNGIADKIQIDELYAQYTYKQIQVLLGSKHREKEYEDLSSTGGDILWSQNARAIPGLVLSIHEPIKIFPWFYAKGQIGHYQLEKERFISKAFIHHKSLYLDLRFTPNNILSGQLSHYAQWGGDSQNLGSQPSTFTDYLKILTGSGGGEGARDSDIINALGNHLGSYELKYMYFGKKYTLSLYHQTLFEDTSGRELRNFPDGVWGAHINLKDSNLINTFLVEYVQTVSQSGRFGNQNTGGTFSGGDNYFANGTYQSGWTYKNRIIGLPFILNNKGGRGIINNRLYALHAGLSGQIKRINYKLKGSFVKNLGTYTTPYSPSEKAIYTFGEFTYPSQYGLFKLQLGADYSNRTKFTGGFSIGYNYTF